MIELPVDLPAELVPLSWLIGVWEGSGVIDYKVGDESVTHEFGQRVSFSHDGMPHLNYTSYTWLFPEEPGGDPRPLATETGYWRIERALGEGEQLRHVPSLPGHPNAAGATAIAAIATTAAAPAMLVLVRVTNPPGRREASCAMSAPSTDAASTMPSAPYTPSAEASWNQSVVPPYASDTTITEPTIAMAHTSTIPGHPPRVSEPACMLSPSASRHRPPASRSIDRTLLLEGVRGAVADPVAGGQR